MWYTRRRPEGHALPLREYVAAEYSGFEVDGLGEQDGHHCGPPWRDQLTPRSAQRINQFNAQRVDMGFRRTADAPDRGCFDL
jgi:hypothetical protein